MGPKSAGNTVLKWVLNLLEKSPKSVGNMVVYVMCVRPYRAIVLVSYCLIDQGWSFGGAFYGCMYGHMCILWFMAVCVIYGYVCEVHSFVGVLLGHSYGCVWLYVCECLAFYGPVWLYV